MSPSSVSPLLLYPSHDNRRAFTVSAAQLDRLVDLKLTDARLLSNLGGAAGICRALAVDPTFGLHPDESFDPSYGIMPSPCKGGTAKFIERRAAFGDNHLPASPTKTVLSLVWAAYNDQTLVMLTVASLVSLAIGIWDDNSANHPVDEPKVGWVDGVAIIVAVIVVVVTNAINDYEKERQFRKLNAKKEDRPVKVLRRGDASQIHVNEVLVGDIMFLEPGDVLTVDCLYIEGHNLRCDESAATGESQTVKKNEFGKGDCIILSGSKVLRGVAKVVVIAVGVNSYYGRAMTLMRQTQDEQTPLQLKLNALADQIAKFGFISAGLMLVVLLIKLAIVNVVLEHWTPRGELLNELIGIIIQAITVIVVAVPEGLPMAVTLALAFATTEMLKDNNLVRHLSACETMGNATAVCSDKTGTLTENKMMVVSATIAEKEFSKISEIQHWRSQIRSTDIELVIEGISVNSTAFESRDFDGNVGFSGSTTECSLYEFIGKLGYTYGSIKSSNKVTSVYPFSSEVKSMTTVIKMNDNKCPGGAANYRIHTKGAAEYIIEQCTHYIDADGNIQLLDTLMRKKKEALVNRYAMRSLRTLALAYRDVDQATFSGFHPDNAPLYDMILIGVVGMQDQLRAGVVESVQVFKQAGVFIRMITGDNIETAKAIATECGILTPGGLAMTGPEFRMLSVKEQYAIIPRLQVLARSSPIDKTIVVTRLQEMNEVVAMTGDGTNDGPALKMANVGFSMGISGTEVAKEASDIILMDDNFNSILQALKWGRAVNDGVRKFLTFQLTVNIAAVVLSFVSAVLSKTSESILSAVQLLWVNMIMDTFAALALATEPLTEELVKRKPLRKDSSLINWRMRRMIIGQAIFQIVINLLLMLHGAQFFELSNSEQDQKVLRTLVFNVFVFLQVFNELNCRRIDDNLNILRGIMRDYLFLTIQAFVIISQILIVQFGGRFFKTVPLTYSQWFYTFCIGSMSIPTGTFIRCMPPYIPYLWSQNRNDEFVHMISYPRLRWEAAIAKVLGGGRFQGVPVLSTRPNSHKSQL